jgi:hypothetical protein
MDSAPVSFEPEPSEAEPEPDLHSNHRRGGQVRICSACATPWKPVAGSGGLNPGAWSRFDWTTHDSDLYYCQTAYASSTEQEAKKTAPADASDPTAGGCGGFAWSRLRTPLAIRGKYTDNYATTHVIQQALWTQTSMYGASAFNITTFDNTAKFLVAQNDVANAYNPGMWSRFDWTTYNSALWYCQVIYDAETAAQAGAAADDDATDPSSAGCGGFPWTAQ